MDGLLVYLFKGAMGMRGREEGRKAKEDELFFLFFLGDFIAGLTRRRGILNTNTTSSNRTLNMDPTPPSPPPPPVPPKINRLREEKKKKVFFWDL